MAYFGVQSRGEPSEAAARTVGRIASSFQANGGPSHWDRAQYLDEAGFTCSGSRWEKSQGCWA